MQEESVIYNVWPSDCNKKTKIFNQKFMTNRENLIKISREGDKTTIRETPH